MLRRGFNLKQYPSGLTLLLDVIDAAIDRALDDDDGGISSTGLLKDIRSRLGRTAAIGRPEANASEAGSEPASTSALAALQAALQDKLACFFRLLADDVASAAADTETGDSVGSRSAPGSVIPASAPTVAHWLVTRAGADPNYMRPSDGYTPLHLACLHGMDEIAGSLLMCGADPNAIAIDSETPMSCAITGKKDNAHLDLSAAARYDRITSMLKSKGGVESWKDVLTVMRSQPGAAGSVYEGHMDPIEREIMRIAQAMRGSSSNSAGSNAAAAGAGGATMQSANGGTSRSSASASSAVGYPHASGQAAPGGLTGSHAGATVGGTSKQSAGSASRADRSGLVSLSGTAAPAKGYAELLAAATAAASTA